MRIYNYLVIILGLILILNLAGIETTSNRILTEFGVMDGSSGITLSEFFFSVEGILSVIAATGTIVIGLYFKSSPESFLLIGYATTILWFVADLVSIITYANANYAGWVASVIGLILSPLAMGYIHSVLSWWGGKA